MCYKYEVQKKNSEKLQKKFDEDNAPEFIQEFFVQISSRVARINYWVTIKEMLLWLIENKHIKSGSIADIKPEELNDLRPAKIIFYLDYLKNEKGIKTTTLQTKKNHMGSFWEYLKSNHYVVDNIVHMVKSDEYKPAKTNQRKMVKMPLQEDIDEMLERINWKKDEFVRTRNMTVFRMLRGTGLRKSELAGLDFSDIHLDNEHPYILVISKGNYDYTDDGKDIVYLTKDATEALKEWIEYRKKCGVKIADHKALFINKNGKRFTEDNISAMFEIYSKGKLTPHMMRHEYITRLMRETNGDITLVLEQARHKSSDVTRFNYDSGASRSLSALEKF